MFLTNLNISLQPFECPVGGLHKTTVVSNFVFRFVEAGLTLDNMLHFKLSFLNRDIG
jgi:hypothetical protein